MSIRERLFEVTKLLPIISLMVVTILIGPMSSVGVAVASSSECVKVPELKEPYVSSKIGRAHV